jgi:hypothetical protein
MEIRFLDWRDEDRDCGDGSPVVAPTFLHAPQDETFLISRRNKRSSHDTR